MNVLCFELRESIYFGDELELLLTRTHTHFEEEDEL